VNNRMTRLELSIKEWRLLLNQMQRLRDKFPNNYIINSIIKKLESNPPRLGLRYDDDEWEYNVEKL